MRSTKSTMLLSCVFAVGASACSELSSDLSDPGIVNDEDPLTSQNGLTANALSSNALSSNALSSNALSSNALSSNALSSNALVMNALRNQNASGDLARMFFRYLVGCALGPNHSVTYTWTDAAGAKHTEVNQGSLAIAPNWENQGATQTDKELVTGCLAARVNSKGIVVPLSIRAKNVSGLSVSSAERSGYSFAEGAFWGNIFASNPYVYSCTRSNYNANGSTSQYLNQGRTCTSAGCGLITAVGTCFSSDYANNGQACFERGGSNDWVSDCNNQQNKYYSVSTHVMTTWLMP